MVNFLKLFSIFFTKLFLQNHPNNSILESISFNENSIKLVGQLITLI